MQIIIVHYKKITEAYPYELQTLNKIIDNIFDIKKIEVVEITEEAMFISIDLLMKMSDQ